MNNSFGNFLIIKRQIKQLSIREFARQINISPEYISKIEKNERTAPSKDILIRISEVLMLNEPDKELLFDLAAMSKSPPALAFDLIDFIMEHPIIHKTLRLSKRENVSDDEWMKFASHIKQNIKKEI